MADWLIAGLIYVPAFLLGRWLSEYIDPFAAGWIAASVAVLLRTTGPEAIRAR